MSQSRPNNGPFHYFAGGTRVPLRDAPDLIAAHRAALAGDSVGKRALDSQATSLPGGYLLFQVDQLPEGIGNQLEQAGLTQPVYRSAGAILVALPEIRVESEDDSLLEEVATSLGDTKGLAISRSPGRLSLTLETGDGSDALVLANSLTERHPGLSVTPRFLRIVERPATAG